MCNLGNSYELVVDVWSLDLTSFLDLCQLLFELSPSCSQTERFFWGEEALQLLLLSERPGGAGLQQLWTRLVQTVHRLQPGRSIQSLLLFTM